ncbi:MAG: 1-phosphofructokinase family hexose kinase [Rhodospirillales bacterium]
MRRILTLTINPSVDIVWEVEEMVPNRKVRSTRGVTYPGGGGINVSRCISLLGGKSWALITRGGLTGTVLTELLDEIGVSRRVVKIAGHTRLSGIIYERSTGQEYRVTPPGPELVEAEWQECLAVVAETEAEYVVATGSLPRGVPTDFYARVAAVAKQRGAKVILDTSGRALYEALEEGVFLVKPSQRELENLLRRKAFTHEQQEELAGRLVHDGKAEIVALTLGEDGAVLVWKDGHLRLPSPKVEVISAVGAGDSFVGGLTYGLSEGWAPADAFALAVATGAAAVMTPGTELCRKEDVERLHAELRAAREVMQAAG